MRHTLNVVTGPAVEPLTVGQLKDHCGVDAGETAHDEKLKAMLATARGDAEEYTQMAFLTQTWDLFFDAFPADAGCALEVPLRPLQSITSIKYINSDGTLTTWDAAKYVVDNKGYRRRPRILPAYGEVWPTLRAGVMNAVEIRLVAGFTAGTGADPGANVPAQVRHALKLLVGEWFINREATNENGRTEEIPLGVQRLLGGFRLPDFS